MLGAELKLLREEREMTQQELAHFLGGDCSRSTVSRWESGHLTIPNWVAQKLLADSEISLPTASMARLLSYAARHHLSFRTLLTQAITEFLSKR